MRRSNTLKLTNVCFSLSTTATVLVLAELVTFVVTWLQTKTAISLQQILTSVSKVTVVERCDASFKVKVCQGLRVILKRSWSNDDGDGEGDRNENGKKAIALDKQDNNSARASCIFFFGTFLWRHCTTTTWKCLISRYVVDVNTTQRLFLLFHNFDTNILEFNSHNNLSTFDELKEMN